MNETTTPTPPKGEPAKEPMKRKGFLSRLIGKLDDSMKKKAEEKSKGGCCGGDGCC